MRRALAALAAVLLLCLLALVGCTPTGTDPTGGVTSSSPQGMRSPVKPPGRSSSAPAPTVTTTPAPGSGLYVAQGHGWTAAGLEGPTYPAGACHSPHVAGGILPDPHCTPGSIDPSVTQDNIASTICSSGYTAGIRPPVTLTGPAKIESAREYGTTTAAGEYDHLVSLELGGSSDTHNLWVEADGKIPNPKDSVENALRLLVCKKVGIPGGYGEPACPTCKATPLTAAQTDIATDWTTAVARATSQAQ